MKKILKKFFVVVACFGLAFVSSIPKSLAFGTSSNQAITHYNEIPINYFLLNANNKLYSSSVDNAIYWLIDKPTLMSQVYQVYNYREGWVQPIDLTTELLFSNSFESEYPDDNYVSLFYGDYYLVNIKQMQLLFGGVWSDITSIGIYWAQAFNAMYNLNGATFPNVAGSDQNKNTIQLLQSNFNNLQLSLQNSDLRDRLIPLYNEGFAFGRQEGVAFGYDLALSELSGSEFYESILAEGKRQGIVEGFNEGFVEGILTAFEGGFEGFGETELRGLKDNISYSYWLGVFAADSGEISGEIYQEGFKAGQLQPTGITWALALFSAMGLFLGVPILGPNITIGVIVGVPLVLSLIFFVIKLIRG